MGKKEILVNGVYFRPAQLREGVETYVEWYIHNPKTGNMERRKKKINYIQDKQERLEFGRHLVRTINDNLRRGVHPFLEDVGMKGVEDVRKVVMMFLSAKELELRSNSIRSYRSYCNTFVEYVCEHYPVLQCAHLNYDFAERFLDWVISEKHVSNRTFNNYRAFLKGLFNWMEAKQYIKENPAANIKSKKEAEKTRVIIVNAQDRQQIKDYFKDTDYSMYIATMFVYHTLLRPGEVVELKPIHFDLTNQTIRIDADNAKSGKKRFATIPDLLMDDLTAWNFNGARSNQYIFGKDMVPGKEPLNPKRLAKKWSKMRERLDMPKEYQLYSLRDTGIVDLLQANTPINDVMLQAGHANLEMTSIYVKHFLPKGISNIKNKTKDF